MQQVRIKEKRVRTGLKIAVVAFHDGENPDTLSGSPHNMLRVLRERGACVHHYFVKSKLRRAIRYSYDSKIWRLVKKVPEKHRKRIKCISKMLAIKIGTKATVSPEKEKTSILARAQRRSNRACSAIQCKPDVIFGFCISSILYALDVGPPIVYFSDATPEIINTTYPEYIDKSEGYKAACDELERVAIRRASYVAYASEKTLRSAINKYELPLDRGFVIPMGANINRNDLPCATPRVNGPDRQNLQLILIGADPIRKRIDLVIEVVEILNQRGWNARLVFIGPPTPRVLQSPLVYSAGRLMLSSLSDRAKMARLISQSHLMILPSLGEAYGIAPCEAAQFGIPSVVSDAGGLPEVVLDGETGMVLPLEAGARQYADMVEKIASDEKLYLKMSRACLERGDSDLNWDSWADRMIPLLERAAANK